MTADQLLATLYDVADDGQASVLDELQRNAGLLWDHVGCWTNNAENRKCERCGADRHALEDIGDVLP